MAEFIAVPQKHSGTLQADLVAAKQLAMKAANALVMSPGAPSQKTMKALHAAFGIEVATWARGDGAGLVGPIRDNFSAIGMRIERTKFRFVAEGRRGHDFAFTDASIPNTINVTPRYFALKARAPTLIHEMIHLQNTSFGESVPPWDPERAHPGGEKIVFDGAPLEIAYNLAIRNPVAYAYFVTLL